MVGWLVGLIDGLIDCLIFVQLLHVLVPTGRVRIMDYASQVTGLRMVMYANVKPDTQAKTVRSEGEYVVV